MRRIDDSHTITLKQTAATAEEIDPRLAEVLRNTSCSHFCLSDFVLESFGFAALVGEQAPAWLQQAHRSRPPHMKKMFTQWCFLMSLV